MSKGTRLALAALIGAMALSITSASADKPLVQQQIRQAFKGQLANPCTTPPDTVAIDGKIHGVAHVHSTNEQNVIRLHLNLADTHGTGTPSGAKYTGNGHINAMVRVAGDLSKGVSFKANFHFHLLRQGQGGDLKIHGQLKGSASTDGVSLDLRLSKIECGPLALSGAASLDVKP
ncbi:MAG TPA: hypothetical protein VM841_02785 [Actinomycetota bacterium]|nr:hypothetical protein [Actinomycetota bacterium]